MNQSFIFVPFALTLSSSFLLMLLPGSTFHTAQKLATFLPAIPLLIVALAAPRGLAAVRPRPIAALCLLVYFAISVLTTQTDVLQIATNFRYHIALPVLFYCNGFLCAYFYQDKFWQILVPPAFAGCIFMLLALRQPFFGELPTGMAVGAASRYFVHPINDQFVIFPVSISESCAAAFILLFLGLTRSSSLKKILCLGLGLSAVVISALSTTRTYIAGVVIALLLTNARVYANPKLFRQLLTMSVGLLAIGAILFSIPEVRSFVEARLTRFTSGGGLLDTGHRGSIWLARLSDSRSTGLFSGASFLQYRSTYIISSHNQYIDYIILSGWLLGLVWTTVFLGSGIKAAIDAWSSRVMDFRTAIAGVLIMFASIMIVSSPMISSKFAYSLAWYIVGAYWASVTLTNRERAKESQTAPTPVPG